jgi:hypothetical protein
MSRTGSSWNFLGNRVLTHFVIQILTGEFRSRKSLFTFNEIEQRL